jgi:predicted unusual protein kinase regulating ubiquinone biosynthesis (AarF/ABC1/UbiB family)
MRPDRAKKAERQYRGGGWALKAHLMAQPSRYAQELLAVTKETGTVRRVEGRDLASIARTPFALRNRRRILERLAGALAEHLALGVVHTDMHPSNIIVSRGTRRNPVGVRLIDYEFAVPLTAEGLEQFEVYRKLSKDLDFTRDYTAVAKTTIQLLGRDEKERRR